MIDIKSLETGKHIIVFRDKDEARRILKMMDKTKIRWSPVMGSTMPSLYTPYYDCGALIVNEGLLASATPRHFIYQYQNNYQDYAIWNFDDIQQLNVGDRVVVNYFYDSKFSGRIGNILRVKEDSVLVFIEKPADKIAAITLEVAYEDVSLCDKE